MANRADAIQRHELEAGRLPWREPLPQEPLHRLIADQLVAVDLRAPQGVNRDHYTSAHIEQSYPRQTTIYGTEVTDDAYGIVIRKNMFGTALPCIIAFTGMRRFQGTISEAIEELASKLEEKARHPHLSDGQRQRFQELQTAIINYRSARSKETFTS